MKMELVALLTIVAAQSTRVAPSAQSSQAK